MSEYEKDLADIPLEKIVWLLKEVYPAWSEKRINAFAKFIFKSPSRHQINILTALRDLSIESDQH